VNTLGDAKIMVNENFEQRDIDTYLRRDSKNMEVIKDLTYKIGTLRNHYILMAARCFDIHRDYEGYTLGAKEFEI
jgi:hypothetical protein